jgi:hypothetical protein
MDRTTDLSAALGFVIHRIEQEAMRSGEPLDEGHFFLLSNLPTKPDAPVFSAGDTELPMNFAPRDTTYERLCALANAAHRHDVELDPGMRDWEFALNVSKLNHHPMVWLLQWAGIKQLRPWWDRWLLVVVALLWIVATMSLMLLVIDREWVLWRWAVVGGGCIGLMFLVLSISRRIEERQLKENIEKYRAAARVVCISSR